MAATFSVRKYRNGTNELAVKTRCLSTRREKKTNKNKQKQHFAWRPRKFCVGEKKRKRLRCLCTNNFFFLFHFSPIKCYQRNYTGRYSSNDVKLNSSPSRRRNRVAKTGIDAYRTHWKNKGKITRTR